jgi:DNA-binding CsgD family transcriptional regulator
MINRPCRCCRRRGDQKPAARRTIAADKELLAARQLPVTGPLEAAARLQRQVARQAVPVPDALRAGRDYMGMSSAATPSMPSSSMAALTRREQQILVLIARGATASDVAGKLNISPLTARKHRENLMRKFDVHNTAELTAYAVRHGVLAG